MTTKSVRDYIDRLDEISRRDLLKGAGAALASAAGVGNASASDIKNIQNQYNIQFGDGDSIARVVPRKAGGRWAITSMQKYLLVVERGGDILLMRVPKEAVMPDLTKSPGSVTKVTPAPDHKPSASYERRVKSRIIPSIYKDPMSARMGEEGSVTVELGMADDGEILNRKIINSSGFARIDNAVLKGIDQTQILPKDTDGRVPKKLVLTFNIGEQIDETSQDAIQKINDLTRNK